MSLELREKGSSAIRPFSAINKKLELALRNFLSEIIILTVLPTKVANIHIFNWLYIKVM